MELHFEDFTLTLKADDLGSNPDEILHAFHYLVENFQPRWSSIIVEQGRSKKRLQSSLCIRKYFKRRRMDLEDGIERYASAQENVYRQALDEIKNGRKTSHWMWFVFPQIIGLGFTDYNIYYGLKGLDEAKEYLDNPVLG